MGSPIDRVDLRLSVSGPGSEVSINGMVLSGVRSVQVNARLREPTEVTITLLAHVNYEPEVL